MNPTVSVIIVTHDRNVKFLARALGSVLSQDLPPEEIVIIDSITDGHRADTRRYLESLDVQNAYIRLAGDRIMSAPDARNLGASLCTGDYLAFLDDDEWYPNKLSSQISVSEDMPAILYSPYIEENDGKSTEFRWIPATYPGILVRNLIGSTSFPLIRSDIFRETESFDSDFKANQEWGLWMRILRFETGAYSSVLAGRKYQNPGLSTDSVARMEGWKMIFSKHREDYSTNKEQHKEAARMFYGDMKHRMNLSSIVSALIENIR